LAGRPRFFGAPSASPVTGGRREQGADVVFAKLDRALVILGEDAGGEFGLFPAGRGSSLRSTRPPPACDEHRLGLAEAVARSVAWFSTAGFHHGS
jgi:hypothetical protein